MPPRKKRIFVALYHSYVDTSSGAAISLKDLMEALAQRGTEVQVLSGPRLDFHEPKTNEELLKEQGIPFKKFLASHQGQRYALCVFHAGGVNGGIWIPEEPQSDPSRAVGEAWLHSYRDIVQSWQPHMVLTYGGFWMFRPMMDIASDARAKRVFLLCNCAYRSGEMFQHVDATIVRSRFHARWCRENLGIEGVPQYSLIPPERYVCEKREPKYLTFVNPQAPKGLYVFAKIAEILQATRPDIPMLIVEGRANSQSLGSTGAKLRNDGLFRMANTPDPRDYLGVTKVMLVPSVVQETFGRVAAEAMMNGIPVVGSNRGSLPEVIGDAGVVLKIPTRITSESRELPTADEMKRWVEAICRLWDDPEHYANLSKRAVSNAQRWTVDSIVEEFKMLWNGLYS